MIIKTKCHCGHINQSDVSIEWARDGSVPIKCGECFEIYVASSVVDEENYNIKENIEKTQEDEPGFAIASRVIIDNKDSELHDQEGIVVDKDHKHYRVYFRDGRSIWLPDHWVVLKKSESVKHKIVNVITILIFVFAAFGFCVFCKKIIELF